ncbi:MAG TPA: hypothetical protein VN950_26585 [Terriglobales bacterium]|nr:hypothetical protein [Terriglobales bacterium]
MLTSSRQRSLPLSVAAAVLICCALALLSPAPLHAYNPRFAVGVPGASPEANWMPAKAVLRKVVHRKPVPFMPYAHVPDYLLVHVTETLECGHTLEIFPGVDPLIAQRRRCQECDRGEVLDVRKKPSGSVRVANVERKRA